MTALSLQTFVCTRLPGRPRLTVVGCGRKRDDADASRSSRYEEDHFRTKPCLDCSVGAAHRAGMSPACWDDGSPIERSTTTVQTSDPPSRKGKAPFFARKSLPFERDAREQAPEPALVPELIEATTPPTEEPLPSLDESATSIPPTAERTVAAERLGLTAEAIRGRVKLGWTPEEAMTTPKGELPPRVAELRATKRAATKTKASPAKTSRAKASTTKRTPPTARTATEAAVRDAIAQVPMRALLERLGYDVTDPVRVLVELGHQVEDLGCAPLGRVLRVS
jgi:hypothetical protein